MAKQKLGIELEAKDKSKAAFSSLNSNIKSTSKEGEEASSKFSGAWKSGLAKVAIGIGSALIAFKALKGAFTSVVSAAAEHEDSLLKLKTAINIAGGSYKDEAENIKNFTDALQEQSRFSNSELVDSMQKIVTISGDIENQYIATQLATDIASTGMFDLASASRNVALALTGEVAMLGRYIPELKASSEEMQGVTTAAGRADVAMRVLNEKFGGAAIENLGSYSAQTDQLENSFADLQREIGEHLLPVLTQLVKDITPAVNKMAAWADSLEFLSIKLNTLRNIMAAVDPLLWGFAASYEGLDTEVVKAMMHIAEKKALLEAEIPSINANKDALAGLKLELQGLTKVKPGGFWELWIEGMVKAGEKFDELYGGYEDKRVKTDEKVKETHVATLSEMLEETIGFQSASYAAWQTGIMSITNAQMTGRKRREAIWKSFQTMALMSISRITFAWLTGESTKTGATIAGFTARVPVYAAEGALAIAAAAKSIYQAVAGIFSWAAKIPFVGVAIGAGFVTAMLAITNQFKKFQRGGMVSGMGGTDNVPALLSAGEFVMPEDKTSQFLPQLLAMRSGSTMNDNSTLNVSVNIGEGSTMTIDDFIDTAIPAIEQAISNRRLLV